MPMGKTDRLTKAIREGRAHESSEIARSGIDLNERDSEGVPPLAVACGYADLELVRLMIARGADANVTDEKGFTP